MKNLELIEKSLKKGSTQQLIAKLGKFNENSDEYQIIISIIEKRGQNVSQWKVAAEVAKAKIEEVVEQPKPIVEEKVIDLSIVKTMVEKLQHNKETNVKVKLTIPANLKLNICDKVKFTCRDSKEEKVGVLRRYFLYKKMKTNYFLIEDESGHFYYKSIKSIKKVINEHIKKS